MTLDPLPPVGRMTALSCADIAAGFRAHGEWLRETTAQLEALLVEPELDPLARLLFALCRTVLGPAAGPLSSPVAGHFRCSWKPHPHTRMKLATLHPEKGLRPIEGFTLRCRVCGGLNMITTSTGSMQRLVMA